MVIRDVCPACGSKRYKKNGHTRHGKQNHQCKACEHQFGAPAEDHLILDTPRTMIELPPQQAAGVVHCGKILYPKLPQHHIHCGSSY